MKKAWITDNKIIEILYDGPSEQSGLQEVPDTAKVGDIYEAAKGSRDENLKTELPVLEELIVTLWEYIISGDKTARDELEKRRQAIFSKYPRP